MKFRRHLAASRKSDLWPIARKKCRLQWFQIPDLFTRNI